MKTQEIDEVNEVVMSRTFMIVLRGKEALVVTRMLPKLKMMVINSGSQEDFTKLVIEFYGNPYDFDIALIYLGILIERSRWDNDPAFGYEL